MASALINKFSEASSPSDEAPLEVFDEVSLANSGTSMASDFRKFRLQEQPSSSVNRRGTRSRNTAFERVDSVPKSPGGSVLARVQMFEAHNTNTHPSPGYKGSPGANKVADAEKKFNAKSKRPTTASYTSRSKESTSFRPSTAPEIDVPVLERIQMRFHQIVSSPTSEKSAYNSRNSEPRWKQRTKESHNEKNTDFAQSIPDVVEQAVDKAIAESKELSERSRKMAMAKKKAANIRANDTVEKYSNTSNERMTPDPLDREAGRKNDTDLLTSPNRRRKFKMVEASMKKDLLKEKGPESVKFNSSSSSISISSVDYGAEPGAISPKEAVERKNDGIHLDHALPTIKHSEMSAFKTDDEYVVSPSSLPGKRDHHRGSRHSDFISLTNPEHSEGGNMGHSLFDQDNTESPVKASRNNPRQQGFHHTESANQIFNIHDAQFSTPLSKHHQSKVNHDQSPNQGHYFAPIVLEGTPHSNFNDDGDDETQFNSVNMQDNCDKSKPKESSQIFSGQASSPHSQGASTKGSDGGSFFFSGSPRMATDEFQENSFTQRNVKYHNGAIPEPPRDDDAESYTDNGSWTGRMRARKAMEQTMNSEKIDQRIDPRWNGMTSNMNTSQHLDGNMTVRDRVFSTVQKQQKDAMSDAQEGFYTFTTEDPKNAAIGLGVAGVLCGAIMLGPLGIVLGAAGAGVGYKVSQMPEDERSEAKSKASSAIQKLQESALAANETISTTCATACGNPQQEERTNPTDEIMARSNGAAYSPPQPVLQNQGLLNTKHDNRPVGMNLKVSNIHLKPKDIVPMKSDQNQMHPSRARQIRRLTPACRRMGRITPVGQIHSLDPALHPLAWLDVMACDWTSRDEKNEAMEEILLLAKDKSHSRNLLDEGILDSLMYILRAFFLNYADVQRQNGEDSMPVETYMADPNFFHSKLAANCCVALGKAHCAMVHFTGDEMIASNTHGPVPIVEQVAKMLYEVPHHMAMNAESDGEVKEVFKITTEMSKDQAEDLASSIVSLSMGKIDIRLQEF